MPARPRLPQITWRRPARYPSGSRYWDSLDGLFRLSASERLGAIELPREYSLWQYKRGRFVRVAESRSRKKLEKVARKRLAQLESEDE